MADSKKLNSFLKQLLVHARVPHTDAEVAAAVGYFGGSLLTYSTLANKAQQLHSLPRAFKLMVEDHRNHVKSMINFTQEETTTLEGRILGLRCYEVLKLITKDNKDVTEEAELREYTNPAVRHLLRTRSPTLPLVGISPETSGLVLSWPGTASVVKELQGRAHEMRLMENYR